MKSWLIAAVALGALAVAGVPTLATALAWNDPRPGDERTGQGRDHEARGKAHAPGQQAKGKDRAKDRVKAWKRGPGAPAWGARKAGKRLDPEWKKEWRKLTPRQRAERMAELARAHAEGMEKWAECVAARRDDCVKPLPPGLARRR